MPMLLNLTRLIPIAFALVAAGCSTGFKPYEAPADIPLQDPPPGQVVVYLIRLPYDGLSVVLSSRGAGLAKLPPGTYTALALRPGRHDIVTTSSGLFASGQEAAPVLSIDMPAGQRRFFYLSGAMRQTASVAGVIPGAIPIPLIVPSMGTQSGTHTWKEASERDAQGLLSNARVVLPD
ncbi:MAG: hypothetical protein Q8Q82_10930 [Hydrogenophaga sp.]|jgi:hypothetical protein|nr:hypothetical protein [Hydrogenophaga sp.]